MARPQRASKKLEIADRRAKVAANLNAGMSPAQIAQALNYSLPTIRRDVASLLKSYQQEQVRNTGDLVTLELERLNRLQFALWAQALDGNANAIDRVLRISESRRKLLGLDAPTVTTLKVETVNQLLAMLPPDLAEEIMRLIQHGAAEPAAEPAVESDPEPDGAAE